MFCLHFGRRKFENYMIKDDNARIDLIRNQVFVNIPVYGTRTHTICLIDDNNKFLFYEKTIKCPINSENPQWLTSAHEFDIAENEN